jgi:hypothetical protein
MTISWSTFHKSAGITLSNSNKTATTSSGNNQIRANSPRDKGKRYIEFQNLSGTTFTVGFGCSAMVSDDNTFFAIRFQSSGTYLSTWGSGSGMSLGTVAGHTVCFAVDLDNNLLWVRIDNGNWNGSGTANPATGTGGIAIPERPALDPHAFLQNACTVDIVSDSGSWAQTAPSGFSDWNTADSGNSCMNIGFMQDFLFNGASSTNRGFFSADVNDVLVVVLHAVSNSLTAFGATSVTGTGSNTLAQYAFEKWTGSSTTQTLEVWYKKITTQIKDGRITVAWSPNNDAGVMVAFTMRNLQDPDNPFDQAGVQSASVTGGTTSAPTVSMTTDGAGQTYVLSGNSSTGNTGSVGVANGSLLYMAGPSFTNTKKSQLGFARQYPDPSSASTSQTLTFGSSVADWGLLAFAFAGPGDTGPPTGGVSVSGDTVTVTASIISGQFLTSVPGQTLTATVSLIAGEGGPISVVDGHQIFEIAANISPAKRYLEADWDSIWSQGDRVANGLMTVGIYGKAGSTPVSQLYDAAYSGGNGFTFGGGSQPANWAHWFDTGVWGIEVRGLALVGPETLDLQDTSRFKFVGGVGVGEISNDSYAIEFDAFSPAETETSVLTDPQYHGMNFTEYQITPRNPILWPHYEFVWVGASTFSGESKFGSELRVKVAHSVLDGGDRRSTNGRPEKQVGFSLGPGWVFRGPSAPYFDPADALFDGDNLTIDSGGHTYTVSQIGTGLNAGTPMSTVGAYIEFTFPRKVVINHVLFQVDSNAQEAFDSGGNPTVFGKWHWEISTDGSTYAQVGPSWHFREACTYMVAPTTDGFGLVGDPAIGDGIQHWRMVLESGPAFGAINLYQIMFNVLDSQDVGVSLSGGFSDNFDDTMSGSPTVVAGSPNQIHFSDSDDDAMSGTLAVTANFTLSADFSDGDSDALDGFGSFSPLIIPQQMVISTGRKT